MQSIWRVRMPFMRIEKELSKYAKIERDIRQGWLFSPDLFNPYNEAILSELDLLLMLIFLGQQKKSYADETVLFVDVERKQQKLRGKVVKKN